jgi:hypothetical protein
MMSSETCAEMSIEAGREVLERLGLPCESARPWGWIKIACDSTLRAGDELAEEARWLLAETAAKDRWAKKGNVAEGLQG